MTRAVQLLVVIPAHHQYQPVAKHQPVRHNLCIINMNYIRSLSC